MKSRQTDVEQKLQPLGPDSLTWKVFGSYHYQLMLPQAFVLQTAHPVINAAVAAEKKYKKDPWGRARDSIALLWPVIYSRPQEAIAMGKKLRQRHRDIKGIDPQGRPYHALDPEAYSWVHVTGFDVMVRLHEFFGTPLSASERAQMFTEWQQVGALLGVHARYIFQTEEAYWEYFNNMIDEKLERGEVVNDLMSRQLYLNYPKPPQSALSDFLWRLLCHPLGWFQRMLIMETLPERCRQRWRLKSTLSNRIAFKLVAWFVKYLYPAFPESRRFIPVARNAIEDARRHPEAYRFKRVTPAPIANDDRHRNKDSAGLQA